jgi:lipopolysaccharide heptosyltransferase II
MGVTFDPKNILIVLHGSIGDVTRALPLANLIRRGFPKATLSWTVEPPSFPLVENYPALDEVILFDRRRWWSTFGPFLRKIRSKRFDLVLDLQRHLKSGFISRWSGARHRVGFHRLDCKEFNWIFNNHFIPETGDVISKLEHYLKFAEYLGLNPRPIEWNFKLTEQEESSVERHLGNVNRSYAVLFVGSRWESKQWFPSQAAECARLIQERHTLDVVLLGGKGDDGLAGEIIETGVSVTNLVGRTSLREAIGVIARARIAVGPDTGLMHIAAAVGTPVVSLWGATSPLRTGPYGFEELTIQGKALCAPCYLKSCPIGRICMQSIEKEEIAGKIRIVLARGSLAGVSDGVRA